MLYSCQEIRDRLIERAVVTAAHEVDVATHLAGCAECAGYARRAAGLLRGFGELERLVPPAELPGRVVAACHEGYLQDRAVAALEAIGRLEMPEEFEFTHLGEHDPRRASPAELEARIDADLRDPQGQLQRRFAMRLERLAVPAELDARVAAELARPVTRSTAPAPLLRLAPQPARRLALMAAGIAALFGGAWLVVRGSFAPPTGEPELALHVEYVDSPAELGPMAALLLGGLSGGITEYETLARAAEPQPPAGEPR